jgi:hypothetical protein
LSKVSRRSLIIVDEGEKDVESMTPTPKVPTIGAN